ncbi:MAG: potassium-transporting ATPase subunit KdpA [Caldilineaceae bacterium]
MVGRTPEYLGKKIEAFEIKMATLAVLLPSACILLFSALAVVTEETGLSSRNGGPHGLTEIMRLLRAPATMAVLLPVSMPTRLFTIA